MAEKRKDSKRRNLRTGESERADGRYMYRYIDPFSGKTKCVYDRSLDELRKKEKQIERDLQDGIDTTAGEKTLNEMFKECMELKKHKLRPSTRQNYLSLYAHNIEKSIGEMKLASIKPMHIIRFYQECVSTKGLSYCTTKLLHNLVYGTLETAVDNDFIRKNLARNCLKEITNTTQEKQPLTADEVRSLLHFCENSSIYSQHLPFLIVALETACRVGELTGITWDCVDLEGKRLSITKQLVYKNFGAGHCEFRIVEPKTAAGKRDIPLSEAACKAFRDLRKNQMLYGIRCNTIIDGHGKFCFLSGNGKPLAANAVNSFLKNIVVAYNKQNPAQPLPHISAHILRHTACTLIAEQGVDVKALQDFMGHSDASITMNVYNHTNFARTKKELEKINSVVGI